MQQRLVPVHNLSGRLAGVGAEHSLAKSAMSALSQMVELGMVL